jgi:hypothetical protein
MANVRRSPHRWWVPLVTIAGSMLAGADASPRELGGKVGSSVACGTAACGVIVPSDVVPGFDKGRAAAIVLRTQPVQAHVCLGAWSDGEFCHLRTHPAPSPSGSHPVAKRPHVGPRSAVRVLSHSHVRVTRLQNGSILCWRDLPPVHIVVVAWDANDHSASDGDDTSDDDDSQNDQSGDDDTDSPAIAWRQATFPDEIAPECAAVTSWVFRFSAHSLTFEPLRC